MGSSSSVSSQRWKRKRWCLQFAAPCSCSSRKMTASCTTPSIRGPLVPPRGICLRWKLARASRTPSITARQATAARERVSNFTKTAHRQFFFTINKPQSDVLTLYAAGFNAETVVTGDFKAQVGLVHIRPLSVFGSKCIFFRAKPCKLNLKKKTKYMNFALVQDFVTKCFIHTREAIGDKTDMLSYKPE